MRRKTTFARALACGLLFGLTGAARPDDGSLQDLSAAPATIELSGPRAKQQLLVSGAFADSHKADLTRDATYESLDPRVVEVGKSGLLLARGNGAAEVMVRHAGRETRVQVHVGEFGEPAPVDFRTEVVAALARGGCNQGACHGSPQGKNGFRLSLRGDDPSIDILSLTRDIFARRTNRADPPESLLLRKATARVAHQGGRRFRGDEPAYRLLEQWIAEGCQYTATAAADFNLEVLPGRRYLHAGSPRQQLVVRAHFDGGPVRDVTDLTVFTSSNDEAATVTAEGLVEFHRTAEVAVLVRYLDRITSVRLTYVHSDAQFAFSAPPVVNFIDQHVFAKQRELQLRPAPLASDGVFLRRVFLDVTGALPTPQEAAAFLDSGNPQKRSELIDALLDRPEYATFWALKWADVMRGNRETITERGVHSFHRYLVRVFAEDRPFDEFAREILTSRGNTIHEPSANFYRISRTPDQAAEAMSQLFLGVRIQCAKCHNHPFEMISQGDYYGLAAYFARVRLKGQQFGRDDEIVYLAESGEVKDPGTGQEVAPAAFGAPTGETLPEQDRREKLADWLIAADNPYFARSTVNRIWSHLFGRGIVEPIDDFRDTNPPANPELLDALAAQFVQGGYHIKPLLRKILNSSTYQLRAEPAQGASPYAADRAAYFTHANVRMLTGEQIIDAISSASGLPELFEGYPLGTRATELAEGAVDNNFLKAFTKPIRDVACDCARETEPSLNEVIHLINNPGILAKIASPQGNLGRWLAHDKPNYKIVELLYLAALSRRPTDAEMQLALEHVATIGDRAAALEDLQHALINSNEFLLRH